MKKYELKRPMKSDWMIMVGNDFKTVKPSELKKHLEDGWIVIRTRYFIITSLLDWWKSLKEGEKIAFFGIILTAFLTCLFWYLTEYIKYQKGNLKTENSLLINRFDSLKKSNDSLNLNFELLNQRFHTLTDSLNQKNKIIENLKLEVKSKKTSGKK